jgi:5,10-methylenetetrahydromethanopterin reductase
VTHTRELGLGLQTEKPLAEYGPLAAAAEDTGFDVVTTFNDLWFQPALPALLEIARATKRVRVGPSCLNPFTLHPVEIAGQVAMLDAASDGRAFLGLARGAWLESLAVDQSDAVTAIREAWELVTRLLAGNESGFAGERFSLPQGSRLRYERRRPRVPLLVGTWSPHLAAFAGEAAQEVKVGGSANPDIVPVLRERIGNDDVRIVLGAVTVVDEDGERARSLARREVAMYLAVVAELDPTFALDPELLARVRSGESEEIPDAVLDRFAFAGTPAQLVEHAEAVFAAGAGRIDFGAQHGFELLCAQVVPRLR